MGVSLAFSTLVHSNLTAFCFITILAFGPSLSSTDPVFGKQTGRRRTRSNSQGGADVIPRLRRAVGDPNKGSSTHLDPKGGPISSHPSTSLYSNRPLYWASVEVFFANAGCQDS